MRDLNEIKAQINRLKRDSKKSRLSKFHSKMLKNQIKYQGKQVKDFDALKSTIGDISEGDNYYIFSNTFDSPNLLLYLAERMEITEIYVSTWAITDRGLYALKVLKEKNIPVNLLLDETYSYKWIFTSGAIDYLDNVNFVFTQNHSKMMLIRSGNLHISILGSMNLSNNPRYENVNIVENEGVYIFFKSQINQFFTNDKTETHQQGDLFISAGIDTKIN